MSDDAAADEGACDATQLLWTCKECYVYQIPPLRNESGHRANDWDVNKWLWQGALKVTATGNTLNILLHDATTGETFANCPVTEPGSKAVDQVRAHGARASGRRSAGAARRRGGSRARHAGAPLARSRALRAPPIAPAPARRRLRR
jgi:hypothetical protein